MKKWIEASVSICKIARGDDLLAKKVAVPRNLRVEPKNTKQKCLRKRRPISSSPQENIWLWLRQSLEKAARQGDKISESSILVRAARIELASLAWKAGILAIIRRPLNILIIISQSEQTYYFCLVIIHRLFQYLRLSY